MDSKKYQEQFEVAYALAANAKQLYVHFDKKLDGTYKEAAVQLAYEAAMVSRVAGMVEAADVVRNLGGWCGGHGEPRCPSPEECARAVAAHAKEAAKGISAVPLAG